MNIEELNIEVEDVSDYNDRCEELLDALCEDLRYQGETIPVKPSIDEHSYAVMVGWQWLWTSKASGIIRAEMDRLGKIGAKYFDSNDVEIQTHMFCEE